MDGWRAGCTLVAGKACGQSGGAWAAVLVVTKEEKSHIFFLPSPCRSLQLRNTESRRLVLTGGKGMDVRCPCITPPRRERGRKRRERKGRCHRRGQPPWRGFVPDSGHRIVVGSWLELPREGAREKIEQLAMPPSVLSSERG
jgi:hypothetical protein